MNVRACSSNLDAVELKLDAIPHPNLTPDPVLPTFSPSTSSSRSSPATPVRGLGSAADPRLRRPDRGCELAADAIKGC